MSFVQNPTNVQKIENEYNKDRKVATKDESSKIPFYFLKKGKTVLRVLPSFNSEGVWFREYWEHRLPLGGKTTSFTCTRQFSQSCVICDKGESLSQSGDEGFKDFQPKRTYLYNVVVLSDAGGTAAKDGVKVLKTGIMVKKQLVDLDRSFSEGYGDITNVENGFSLSIEREGETMKDTRYTVKAHRERTNIKEVLKAQNVDDSKLTQYDLGSAVPGPRPVEEMLAAIEGKRSVYGFPSVAVEPRVQISVVPVVQPVTIPGINTVTVPVIPEPPSS
jgi:hypothetical protein